MRISATVLALILVLVWLPGCGDDAPGKPPSKEAPTKETPAKDAPDDPTPSIEAEEARRRAQQAKPPEYWRVLMTFETDPAAARKAGRIGKDADARELMDEVVEIVAQRIQALKPGEFGVKAASETRFYVGFRVLPVERREAIAALVTRVGTLEFLIEVLPDAEYAKRMDPDDDAPARTGLWRGSAAAFEAFKAAEIAGWKQAAAAGEAHVPTQPAYRLALASGKDGSAAEHFHVLEVPSEAETFDGRMVARPVVSFDQINMPVVIFDVRKAWQEAFGIWTAKNVRLPLAIVLDGAVHSAPTIRSRLTTNVQISFGQGPRSDLARQAEELVNVLQSGALPLRPKLVSIEER